MVIYGIILILAIIMMAMMICMILYRLDEKMKLKE